MVDPAAVGPNAGRDRVLVRQSPDRSQSPQPSLVKDGKYTVGFENAFAARGDARPPRQGLLDRLC
jgi:hypothetical protein